MNSLMLLTGSDGCTTSIIGSDAISVIGAKSLIGSNDTFCSTGVTAKAKVVTRSVWPSGAALATAAVPIALPAPGRLLTITVCDQLSVKRCPIRRAMLSVVPPATNGTTSSICFDGKTCAERRRRSGKRNQCNDSAGSTCRTHRRSSELQRLDPTRLEEPITDLAPSAAGLRA